MKTMRITGLVVLLVMLCGFVQGCAKLNPNTETQLLSALEAKTEAFKACYVTALDRDREVEGSMGLGLKLNEESGDVTSSEIENSDIEDTDMQKCVVDAADDISLPEPPGVPVEGHYDLAFGFEE
jgi:hypothetical protein